MDLTNFKTIKHHHSVPINKQPAMYDILFKMVLKLFKYVNFFQKSIQR